MPVTIFRNWNFAVSQNFHIYTQLLPADKCLHVIYQNAVFWAWIAREQYVFVST